MSTTYKLSSGDRGPVRVTRWWAGRYLWTLDEPTLDAAQIAELFALLDPVVGEALLKAAREGLVRNVG